MYAAQFYEHAKRNIDNLEQKISDGDFSELSKWLKTNVYEKGRLWTSEEICKSSTGESLNSQYFVDYANKKYGEIYAL